MLPRLAISVLSAFVFIFPAPTASAQEQLASASMVAPPGALPDALSRAALLSAAATPATPIADATFRTNAPDFSRLRRPALLPALYATNAALQALDAHSTLTALDHGAREANPLMKGVVDSPGALLAVKAGAAVGTIYFAEKLWRRNRVAAVALMVAVNGATAAVVAHNYRVAARLR